MVLVPSSESADDDDEHGQRKGQQRLKDAWWAPGAVPTLGKYLLLHNNSRGEVLTSSPFSSWRYWQNHPREEVGSGSHESGSYLQHGMASCVPWQEMQTHWQVPVGVVRSDLGLALPLPLLPLCPHPSYFSLDVPCPFPAQSSWTWGSLHLGPDSLSQGSAQWHLFRETSCLKFLNRLPVVTQLPTLLEFFSDNLSWWYDILIYRLCLL